VAEYRSCSAASPAIVVRCKQPAAFGVDTKRSKRVAAHPQQSYRPHVRTLADRRRAVAPREQTIERLLMITDLLEQGIRHVRGKAVDAHAAMGILDTDARELRRIHHWQRPQADDIDQMKDRGVGADAERQRQDRHA
jgi:hypothetical protein